MKRTALSGRAIARASVRSIRTGALIAFYLSLLAPVGIGQASAATHHKRASAPSAETKFREAVSQLARYSAIDGGDVDACKTTVGKIVGTDVQFLDSCVYINKSDHVNRRTQSLATVHFDALDLEHARVKPLCNAQEGYCGAQCDDCYGVFVTGRNNVNAVRWTNLQRAGAPPEDNTEYTLDAQNRSSAEHLLQAMTQMQSYLGAKTQTSRAVTASADTISPAAAQAPAQERRSPRCTAVRGAPNYADSVAGNVVIGVGHAATLDEAVAFAKQEAANRGGKIEDANDRYYLFTDCVKQHGAVAAWFKEDGDLIREWGFGFNDDMDAAKAQALDMCINTQANEHAETYQEARREGCKVSMEW